MPSTARTTPRVVTKWTCRSSTSRSQGLWASCAGAATVAVGRSILWCVIVIGALQAIERVSPCQAQRSNINAHGERLVQDTRDVQRLASGAIVDLMAATGAVSNNQCLRIRIAHRRKQ